MMTPEDILSFWLDEVGPDGWYTRNESVDDAIRSRFRTVWDGAMEGRYGLWLTHPSGVLAYIILLDQFPRNMFRGEARAFQSDPIALAAAKQAIHRGWDLKIDPPGRQFFYLPLEHSENLSDQDRAVRLIKDRLDSDETLLHARVHREVIRRFGRFPYRNAALGRTTSEAEARFLDEEGGYGAVLRSMRAPEAA